MRRLFKIAAIAILASLDPALAAGLEDPFEEVVNLPACDPTEPTVRIIRQQADWADINDPAIRVFCVQPGDYRELGVIKIESSGTAAAPRVLRYYDASGETDDTHPVHMAANKRAVIQRIALTGASHWLVDRLAVLNDDTNPSLNNRTVAVQFGSSNNIMNGLLVEGGRTGVRLYQGSNYNVLQHSVVRNTIIAAGDSNCINLSHHYKNEQLLGNRIVSNEAYDCTDSLQLVIVLRNVGSTFPGTVVANNDFYVTPARYSDCNGNLDPEGACACAEGRFDIKAGGTSAAPEGRVHVTRNRIWGSRRTDPGCGGGGSWGTGLETCCNHGNPIQYVLLENNIVMDVARGLGTTGSDRATVRDNLLYHVYSPYDEGGMALMITGDHTEVYRNTIIDSVRWAFFGGDDADVRCNVIIDGGKQFTKGTGVQGGHNAYYNSGPLPGTNDISFSSASDAKHEDLCFTRRRITAPETECIPNGKVTSASPHFQYCDANLGSRRGIGLDDDPPPSPPSGP